MEGQLRMHYLTSSEMGCLCQSLCLNGMCGSLGVKRNLKMGEVGVVFSSPLGCFLGVRHGTGPEMSRVTRSILPRWLGTALCETKCGGSGARKSHWLPVLETAAGPCRGRNGNTKARPHDSTPGQTGGQEMIFGQLEKSRKKLIQHMKHF